MKFKYGDFVYIPKEGVSEMQVIDFDEKKQKYRCVFFCSYSPGDDATAIEFVAEEELDLIRNDKGEYEYQDEEPFFPRDIDQNYFDIYEYIDGKDVLIRKEFRKRKPFEIPTVKKG